MANAARSTRNRTEIQGEVTRYPAGGVTIVNPIIIGPTSHYADLWQELADIVGAEPEYEQVFCLKREEGPLYIMFTEDKTYFALSIF